MFSGSLLKLITNLTNFTYISWLILWWVTIKVLLVSWERWFIAIRVVSFVTGFISIWVVAIEGWVVGDFSPLVAQADHIGRLFGISFSLNLRKILTLTKSAASDDRFRANTPDIPPKSHSRPPEDALLDRKGNATCTRHGIDLYWRPHQAHKSSGLFQPCLIELPCWFRISISASSSFLAVCGQRTMRSSLSWPSNTSMAMHRRFTVLAFLLGSLDGLAVQHRASLCATGTATASGNRMF